MFNMVSFNIFVHMLVLSRQIQVSLAMTLLDYKVCLLSISLYMCVCLFWGHTSSAKALPLTLYSEIILAAQGAVWDARGGHMLGLYCLLL